MSSHSQKPLAYRLSQVNALARSTTAKNSFIVFGGNFLNSLLSFVAVIVVSRTLGPADFGILAIFNTILTMIVGITDGGLGTTAIKLISGYLANNNKKATATMRTIFKIEVSGGILIALTGLLFSPQIARLLGGEHLLLAVRLSFLASVFQSTAAFFGPFFVVYQQFTKNALVNFFGVAIRVAGILLLMATATLTLNNALWVYTLAPILFFFVGLSVVPKGFLQKIPKIQEKEAFKEIFHFSKWLLLSFVATTIASRLDLLLLSRIKGSTEVGLYAVALQLASVMPLLTGAITTVLLPRVSQMRQQQEFISYIKKVLLGSGVLVLVLLPMVFLGDSLINLFFGSRFNGSMAPFKVIFISYLLALIINPVGQIIYALNRPQVFTALNYVQLALSVALNLLLIPKFGIMGAALTILLLHILGGVFIGGYVAKIVKEVPS